MFRKVFIIIIVSLTSLNFALASNPQSDASLEQFQVGKYLTTPPSNGKTTQGNSYFKMAEDKKTSPIGAFLLIVITYLLMTIGTVSILMIVFGGIILMSSGGNESSVEKGKDVIFYAVIGVIVAFAAYIISIFVQSLLYV